MADKIDKTLARLLDVSATMLITLHGRAMETRSRNPVLEDIKAVEIIDIIKKEITGSKNPIHRKILGDRYNKKLGVTLALRSRRFDRYVTEFMKDHPQGTVINLGCGLDTRFDRIDNGRVRWFDIDFPDVIELRSRFLKETDRRKFIGSSILETGWLNQIKTGGPFLVLAEGVFMYLEEAQVKGLLGMLKKSLGSYELVAEVSNRFWVERMKSRYMRFKFRYQLGMSNVFTFGVPESRYFEGWSPDYRFIDEWTYFDDREKKLGWFNLFRHVRILRMVQWTVHYRIG